jgi:hypothetical protein
MEFDPVTIVITIAIAAMLYCMWMVVSLKSQIPGGVVGSKWNIVILLVALFTAGYMALPFFNRIPDEILRMIVSFVFLGGAIYVLITVRLIYAIIQELTE